MHRKVNTDFFKIWTADMAYVLGFFFADGSLTFGKRKNYYLSFHSADKSLLLAIRKVLGSTHAVSKRSARSGGVYRLQIGSMEMCHDLLNLGLSTRKTKRLILPDIPQEFIGDFVRGYFDGDGNVWSGVINKHRKKPSSVIQVFFTSGCGLFLHNLHKVLKNEGIEGGSVFPVKNKQCERLGLSTGDALKVYEIMYNSPHKLHLPRKKRVFEQFIKNAVVV